MNGFTFTGLSKRGDQLHADDRAYVLSAYIGRHTAQKRAYWAKPNTPVHFMNDSEWLSNTWFAVRKDGRLDRRVQRSESHPTFPLNPELRK